MTKIFVEIRKALHQREVHRVSDPVEWRAAVALILRPSSRGDLELLLIKRAERDGDPWSGQIGLPGGKSDGADLTLLDTARRETLEETAVKLSSDSLLGELDDLYPRIAALPDILVRPFVFGLSEPPKVIPNVEVAMHLWVPITTLRAGSQKVGMTVRGQEMVVDAVVIGEHVLWGMTHRILMPFLALLA